MGSATEDFIESFIYDLPAQKRFKGAKVVRYKQTRQLGDDWDANVGGNYVALVYKKGKPYAIITYKVRLGDRYKTILANKEGDVSYEEEQYDSFEDAANIKIQKIRLIKSVPKMFK